MSHLLEALKKAETRNAERRLASPKAFLGMAGRAPDLSGVPCESANISLESRLAVWSSPQSLAADRFRLLRIQLQKLQAAGKLKTLLLTSPGPQDGKSTVVLNLATSLANQGKQRVLVLEADLRCPTLAQRLGLKSWSGLLDCLREGSDPISSLRRVDPLAFYLLPAGGPAESPTELLQSEHFARVIQTLVQSFDWILVDSPPASPVADTVVLRQRADGYLLVVRSGQTPREAVAESIQQLGPPFLLGIVLNALESIDGEYRSYYRKYKRDDSAAQPTVNASNNGSGSQ